MIWLVGIAGALIAFSIGFLFGVWWACARLNPEIDLIDDQRKEWP